MSNKSRPLVVHIDAQHAPARLCSIQQDNLVSPDGRRRVLLPAAGEHPNTDNWTDPNPSSGRGGRAFGPRR